MRIHKNLFGLAALLVVTVCLSSCEDEINPSSTITTEELTVGDFNSVKVSSGFDVEIFYSDDEYILIESNENLHPYIVATQENGQLTIRLDKGTNISGGSILKARVYTNNPLTGIEVAQASRLTATEATFSDVVALDLTGASFLRTEMDVEDLAVEVSGKSNLELEGFANNASLTVSDGARVQDDRFSANFATLELTGGSSAELMINQEIRLTASGSSVLKYGGDAVIKAIDLTSGATIEKID